MRPTSVVFAPTSGAGRGPDPTDPEAIVRVLFEKSPLLIYIADLDYKIVLFNRALRDATGYDTSDCRNVGKLLERFYPDPEYRQIVQGIHDGWVRNEHIRDAELVCTLKDQTQRTISWSTSRLRVGRGPTIGYIALGVDVTTRRNLQQWVSLFQKSLQYLDEGVVLTDPGGQILAWSVGAERLLGYTEQDMAGRPLEDLYLRGERKLIARTVDRAIETDGSYAGEVELERKEGGSSILVFNQFRLDGDTGPALARLTLLTRPSADEDVEARLAEATELATHHRTEIENARELLNERERRIGELEQGVAAATQQAGEGATRIGELEQMLGALEAAAEQVAHDSERAADGAAVALAIAEGEAADARDELAAAQARVAELEDSGVKAAEQLAQAMARAEQAEQRTEEAEADVARLAVQLAEQTATAEEARAQAEEGRAEAEAARAAAQQAGMDIVGVKASADAAKAEAEAAKAEAEAAKGAAETAQTEAEAARAETEAAKADAEAAKADAEAAKASAEAAKADAEAARTDAEAARTDAEAAKAETAAARTDAEAARTDAEAARTEAEVARGELDDARSEVDAAKDQAEQALSTSEQAVADAEAISASIDAARADAEAAKANADAARAEAEAAKADAETARAEAEAAKAEAEAARADSAEAEPSEGASKVAAIQELLDASEASRLAAEEEVVGKTAELEKLQTLLAEAEARVEELQAKPNADADADADADAKPDDATAQITELTAQLEAATAEVDDAAEAWVQERSQLQEAQRAAVAEAQAKAAEDRKGLEEQLSRDILAAEERAEAERAKLLERHEQERLEWEDATEIARAEVESRMRQEMEQLKGRVDSTGDLQPHLVPLESIAFVAANTEGRVVGWSGGAALLDGRSGTEALGAFLHRDVLRLDKVDWKGLFGKVVVTGQLEREVTLLDRSGGRHDVVLKARLVKGERGQPIGVTEVLQRPALGASLEVHARAATARLAAPLHRALETRAIAGLRSHQGAAGAVKDLLTVAQSVHDATDWADVEGAARRVDLGELLRVTDDLVGRSEDTWRELRATAQDLLWLEDVAAGSPDGRLRWNELITRCLHAIEDASGTRAKRSFGNQAFVLGRGDALVPLVLALLGPIGDAPGAVEVSASVEDGDARLVVTGAAPSGDDAALVRLLATEAGGTLDVRSGRKPGATLTVPLEPPEEAIPADEDFADSEDDRTAPPTKPMKAVVLPEDDEAEVVEAADVELEDAEPDPPTDGDIDLAELAVDDLEEASVADAPVPPEDEKTQTVATEADAERPRRGRVDLIEEQDDGGLVLMAGEDSVVVQSKDLRAAIEADVEQANELEPTESQLPEIDELERLFDEAVKVSPSILATADEMDAYVSTEPSNDGLDAAATSAEVAATDAKTDAGRRLPEPPAEPAPTEAAMKEMASTDTGERLNGAKEGAEEAAAKADGESKSKAKGKKPSRKRKKSSRRSRRRS